jgi:cystathionine beta-lyase/cystathionine gamma-synthase
MSLKRRHWDINTKLNHPVEVTLSEGNRPLLQPIYHSAKFVPSENYSYWDQFIYSRISNPTTRQLELTLAEIQEREECVVMASGISAITSTFLSLLSAGDHIISFREIYKPARVYIKSFLSRYKIEHTLLSLSNIEDLEKAIVQSKTKLIHFESPSNPNLDIADIDYIIKTARKYGVLVSMDGTFAGLHQHTRFDIDIMIQSLTKFANGHGDVIAGSVSGKSELIKKIREMNIYLGSTLDPQAAYLIERGLKTYMLRFERQTASAGEVARYLNSHPGVKNVRYPGLESHKSHQLAKKQMSDMGSIIAFEINPSVATSADKFCHKLKLIQLAASLGASETIICPTQIFFGDDLNATEKEMIGINEMSLRLSVGLESPTDIINDLETALGKG